MFGRHHAVLAALLAIQLLALAAIRSPVTTGPSRPRPLLPELASMTPSRIELEGQGGARLTLERKDDRWTLPDAGGYPASEEKVDKLLDDLKGLKVRRPVVTSARHHAALEVAEDKHARRVRIFADADEDPEIDLLVGSSPKYRFVHVRRAGEDPVYEVMGLSPYDIRAEKTSWIERKLVDVPFDEVRRVEVENASGRFVLERDEGSWRLAEPSRRSGQKLDSGKVDAFVRSLVSLWIAEPVGPADDKAHGFDAPAARYTIAYAQGGGSAGEDGGEEDGTEEPEKDREPPLSTVTVIVGRKADGQSARRYATREGFGFTVEVSETSVKKALEQKAADLR
ncbi:MAG: DUF4340 domain-containing protein [Acidobacteria bacterium]|nr:MAG: DUF4340 domain-containing protein [Acidobacteriota bacterium]